MVLAETNPMLEPKSEVLSFDELEHVVLDDWCPIYASTKSVPECLECAAKLNSTTDIVYSYCNRKHFSCISCLISTLFKHREPLSGKLPMHVRCPKCFYNGLVQPAFVENMTYPGYHVINGHFVMDKIITEDDASLAYDQSKHYFYQQKLLFWKPYTRAEQQQVGKIKPSLFHGELSRMLGAKLYVKPTSFARVEACLASKLYIYSQRVRDDRIVISREASVEQYNAAMRSYHKPSKFLDEDFSKPSYKQYQVRVQIFSHQQISAWWDFWRRVLFLLRICAYYLFLWPLKKVLGPTWYTDYYLTAPENDHVNIDNFSGFNNIVNYASSKRSIFDGKFVCYTWCIVDMNLVNHILTKRIASSNHAGLQRFIKGQMTDIAINHDHLVIRASAQFAYQRIMTERIFEDLTSLPPDKDLPLEKKSFW